MKPQRVVRVLMKLGFEHVRQKGGHAIFMHHTKRTMVVVPMHSGDIKKGLLLGIIKQAEVSRQQFIDLL